MNFGYFSILFLFLNLVHIGISRCNSVFFLNLFILIYSEIIKKINHQSFLFSQDIYSAVLILLNNICIEKEHYPIIGFNN